MADYDDQIYMNPIIQPPGAVIISEGATLRDYFAAMADMAPYSELIARWVALKGTVTTEDMAACLARIRYAEADAMLTARTGLPPITGDHDA